MKKFGKKIIAVGCIFAWCLLIAFGFSVSSSYASPQQPVSLVEQSSPPPQNIQTEELAKYTFLPDSVEEKMKENWDKEPLTDKLDRYLLHGHAWALFALISQKCPSMNSAVWETWADDVQTFPQNPKVPPKWPGECNTSEKKLRSRSKVERPRRRLGLVKSEVGIEVDTCTSDTPICEEVRRNKASFEYIVTNKLWNQDGRKKAFQNASTTTQKQPDQFIDFPVNTIEIKADWCKVGYEGDPCKLKEGKSKGYDYYQVNVNNQKYALVGMHIMTKEFPNWFWATWEWGGNPSRCDYIGCHDSFGLTGDDRDRQPNPQVAQGYSKEKLSQELEELFNEYGLTGDWGDILKNYRLKGTQISFVNEIGEPTLLGNSIIEEGFVPSSSCVTCHARATINSNGLAGLSIFKFPLPQPPETESYNGSPNPSWYVDESSENFKNLPADFVWALINQDKPSSQSKARSQQ